jgi:hypothetical protein
MIGSHDIIAKIGANSISSFIKAQSRSVNTGKLANNNETKDCNVYETFKKDSTNLNHCHQYKLGV